MHTTLLLLKLGGQGEALAARIGVTPPFSYNRCCLSSASSYGATGEEE
ncbi:MAG: hypothetical protein ACREVE_12705 [Gammaproteobacteria bacterium]